MSMRISTNQFHTQSFSSINKHQNDILDIQEKLSTGNRVNKPGDDPVATTQIHSLNKTINTISQFEKNGEYAKSQLDLEETAISDTVESLQRARELTIQMMNDTYTPSNRLATAQEIGQIIDHVKNMMNYRNSEGESIFAGNDVDQVPFVADTNNYDNTAAVPAPTAPDAAFNEFFTYIGGAQAATGTATGQILTANFGARFVQIGFDSDNKHQPDDLGDPSRVRISDNGNQVFQIPGGATSLAKYDDGAGNVPDNNVLNVLIELKRNLEAGVAPPDEIADDLHSSITQLSEVRAQIGGRQNRIQSQYDAGQAFTLSLEERRMNIEEQDVVEGISELTQKQNALQMAQQVFIRVQDLSLFNYLG